MPASTRPVPKRGGRPRKQPGELRSASVRADLTAQEKEHVRRQARRAGLTEAEFLRRRLLGFEVSSSARRTVDPALLVELNRVGLQLSTAGNLANQLARSVHTGRRFQNDWTVVRDELLRLKDCASDLLARVAAGHGP